MDMPGIFYAVRPMNTDRSAPPRGGPGGDHRWLRVYGYINYDAVVRTRAAARTREASARVAAGHIALRFIGRLRARIRREEERDTYPVTIYVINRRFVSTLRVPR